jgi:hypothetical protein
MEVPRAIPIRRPLCDGQQAKLIATLHTRNRAGTAHGTRRDQSAATGFGIAALDIPGAGDMLATTVALELPVIWLR